MHRLSDFDFELPPALIAQYPVANRSDSRLLVVDPTASGETTRGGVMHVRDGQTTDKKLQSEQFSDTQFGDTQFGDTQFGDEQSKDHRFKDCQFKDLIDLVNPGDVLVFNNSKVIPARLYGIKETGGAVEILVERIISTHEAMVLLRVSKKPAPGSVIRLTQSRPDATQAGRHASQPDVGCNVHSTGNDPALSQNYPIITVLGRDPDHDDRFRLQFDQPVLDVLYAHGEIPLPPYIEHTPDEEDVTRYQTVYAATPGSVAAPTAGLHFDEAMLHALDQKGINRAFVTLHVGTGTFAPVRTENLDEHRMHSEWCEISQDTADMIAKARNDNKRVIAVGTTSLRTLESAALPGGLVKTGAWDTDIFIRPGYRFGVVDGLLTNFHLPKSTLLMLVAAFIGYDTMRAAYAHAVAQRYRFFSYGDAMFCVSQKELMP